MRTKELIKALEQKGWILSRIQGSHHIMTKPGCRSIPIPFHGNNDLDAKFIRLIEKQSGEKLQ